MIVNKRIYGYRSQKKYVIGSGFIDSLSSIFNSVKSSVLPTLSGVGSYLKTNKDLILKPLLGAVGTLGAKALTEGIPAVIKKIQQKNKSNPLLQQNNDTVPDLTILEDPKFKELLQNAIIQPSTSTPVSNIIGSGYKKRGSGIKKF